MNWKSWNEIPQFIKSEKVKSYYIILSKKKFELKIKRVFDVILSLLLLIFLCPFMLVISIAIKLSSKGKIFFFQTRVTQYGKKFKIIKFRTMIEHAQKFGTQITTKEDKRVTKIGKVLRKYRIDELPQLINILVGDMSFVGTRPETPQYVREYTASMKATLLLPAGVTSLASIRFKDEELLLDGKSNVDEIYINKILPKKMKWNLLYLKKFNLWNDFKILIKTISAVWHIHL